jgi:Flp pilus assembly protein TadD
MELRAEDGAKAFTPERAGQDLDYWRSTTQQLLADPEASGSAAALKSYSHNATAAANLLVAHNFTDEAEQTFRLSSQLWPGNPEPVAALSDLLTRNGRAGEARKLVEDFVAKNPDQRAAVESPGWKATSAPLAPDVSPR